MAMVVWTVIGGGPTVVVTSSMRVGSAPASFKPDARIYDPHQELQCPHV